ncbi:aminotransferase class I/II-fold pyridoxal phosphate-dependent enzyme [Pseudomonas sp. TH41]|uniref:aminotransferase class I/II-fold pyridoxal phosphate-dependent enzyme n=1 Tax=Pseudomonas sp. TH41 TaxID=2796405 RepID=UPI00191353F0|nr:aminotransferase class I/II-fold pyridoxal phosphate-dependent enzyme [Pseudomonas sp. TH41]MBK5353011.1 aminotransferase class I/II-fold pyridoxal phosphate-dependent enzyme [Pseudomonas sp. TH41]
MKILSNSNNGNLTELEVFGLSAKYNLADGHSYISAEKHFNTVLSELPALWRSAIEIPIPEMEVLFKNKFAEYFGLEGLSEHANFSVCPTASNSIDIVGAWARSMNYKIGLVEPTFDNLAQLLRRREVMIEAIPEMAFTNLLLLEKYLEDKQLDALFLVNPNNPTGLVIDSAAMSSIVDLCCRHDVVLILDTSFRFCHETEIDEYTLLLDKKLSFIIIEDTGKQWPTLDAKASLLSYSADLASDIRSIYEEIYLCCSNFSLNVIKEFIDATLKKGGLPYMHSIITKNNEIAKSALENSLVTIDAVQQNSKMTVMWLNIEKTGLSDLELTTYLASYGVAVLPGRYFFWNSHNVAGHNRIRIALFKPDDQIGPSIERLKNALTELQNVTIPQRERKAETLS